MAVNGGIQETYNRQSQEIMEPEAFFPLAKDPTTVRAAQLAVLQLLKQPEEIRRKLSPLQGIFKSEDFSCSS